ncbi:hypothetical protein J3459_008322 [Metarhizium acridum]|nr:hypothetical protein J3459_008322 [Metarhizium acridum]
MPARGRNLREAFLRQVSGSCVQFAIFLRTQFAHLPVDAFSCWKFSPEQKTGKSNSCERDCHLVWGIILILVRVTLTPPETLPSIGQALAPCLNEPPAALE